MALVNDQQEKEQLILSEYQNTKKQLYDELMQLKNKPKSLEQQGDVEIEVNEENGGN